jgi:hypothetical protein
MEKELLPQRERLIAGRQAGRQLERKAGRQAACNRATNVNFGEWRKKPQIYGRHAMRRLKKHFPEHSQISPGFRKRIPVAKFKAIVHY